MLLWSLFRKQSCSISFKTNEVFHEHYCQICIPIYLQFSSLFAPYFCKCEIICQQIQEDYISRMQTSLVWFISNGTAKIRLAIEFFTVCTKLAKMAILYSKDLTTAKKSYLQWGSTKLPFLCFVQTVKNSTLGILVLWRFCEKHFWNVALKL